jgi:hypothetical protein
MNPIEPSTAVPAQETSKREIVFLMTPQHTGTHFCRMLLETHPRISPCLAAGNFPVHKEEQSAMNFLSGRCTLQEWKDAFSRRLGQIGAQKFDEAEGFFNEFSIRIEPKPDPTHFLFHDHIHPPYVHRGFRMDTGNFERIKIVTAVRDPLLSVISALRRTPKGVEKSALILRGILFASRLTNVFHFCTDLWKDSPEKALGVFSYLGLDTPSAAREYLKKYPVINHTQSTAPLAGFLTKLSRQPMSLMQAGSENVPEPHNELYPALDESVLKELRDARELLVKKKKIHPVIRPWADVLRRNTEFEAFYRKLGYRDLVWFK